MLCLTSGSLVPILGQIDAIHILTPSLYLMLVRSIISTSYYEKLML